jgi:uncharacterized protein YkwD
LAIPREIRVVTPAACAKARGVKGRVSIFGLFVAVAAGHGAETSEPTVRTEMPRFVIQLQPIGSGADTASEKFSLAELNAALLKETNRVRGVHGLRALQLLPALAGAADDHTAFMVLTFTVSHTSPIPGRKNALERAKEHGLGFASLVAENVLSTAFAAPHHSPDACTEIAATLVAQWMDSPGHRANLLHRGFTDVGCAVRYAVFPGGGEKFFATQVFAAR